MLVRRPRHLAILLVLELAICVMQIGTLHNSRVQPLEVAEETALETDAGEQRHRGNRPRLRAITDARRIVTRLSDLARSGDKASAVGSQAYGARYRASFWQHRLASQLLWKAAAGSTLQSQGVCLRV